MMKCFLRTNTGRFVYVWLAVMVLLQGCGEDKGAARRELRDGSVQDSSSMPHDTNPAWLSGLVGFATVNAWGQDGTTGGLGGPTVTVRSPEELMHYIAVDVPMVIQVEGTIVLPTDTYKNGVSAYGMNFVSSHKTIIGIGEAPTIKAGGFGLGLYPFDDSVVALPDKAVHNIIIRNLTFDGTDGVDGETDGINVFMFTHHVWIDHCTFKNSVDGSVDIKRGSSFITVSNNLFEEQFQPCMLGHSEGEPALAQDGGNLKVTYHQNWFRRCHTRMPLARFGEVHVLNNYWSDVIDHAIGIGEKASVHSENNFLDGGNFSYVYSLDGALQDQGTLGGISHNGSLVTWNPRDYYPYTPLLTDEVKTYVMANAGAGKLTFLAE
jgi:pectate lyase